MRIINTLSVINSYSRHGVNNGNAAKGIEGSGSSGRSRRTDHGTMGVSLSGKLRVNDRGLSDASRRNQESITSIQIADSALEKTQNTLQRMQELASRSADVINSEHDRMALEFDYTKFKFEICDLCTVRFNGVDLIRTDAPVTLAFQMDSDSVYDVTIKAVNADNFGSIDSVNAARDALANLSSAANDISATRDELSSILGQLQNSFRSSEATSERSHASERAVRDADTARQIADSIRNAITLRPSSATLAQGNVMQQGALQLLG